MEYLTSLVSSLNEYYYQNKIENREKKVQYNTTCRECGIAIVIGISNERFKEIRRIQIEYKRKGESFTCNQCIPKYSSLRNGFDEEYETEVNK